MTRTSPRFAPLAALAVLTVAPASAFAQREPRVRVELPAMSPPRSDPSDRRSDEARALEAQLAGLRASDTQCVAILFRLDEIYTSLAFDARAAGHESESSDLSRRALSAVTRLARDFPRDARADEALALLARHQLDASDWDAAQRSYEELLRRFPQSRFVPHALVGLGDRAFDQGDMTRARPLYERAAAASPGANPMRAYALYKLAWVLYNVSDYRGSVARFTECLAEARAHAELSTNAAMLRSAGNDLAAVYASLLQSGPFVPADALQTLTRAVADEARGAELLARVAESLADAGHADRARQAYEYLIATRSTDAHAAEWRQALAALPAPAH